MKYYYHHNGFRGWYQTTKITEPTNYCTGDEIDIEDKDSFPTCECGKIISPKQKKCWDCHVRSGGKF